MGKERGEYRVDTNLRKSLLALKKGGQRWPESGQVKRKKKNSRVSHKELWWGISIEKKGEGKI